MADEKERPKALRPISPEEMAEYEKELEKIDWDALIPDFTPRAGGFPIMPHSPFWNPRPGPPYR